MQLKQITLHAVHIADFIYSEYLTTLRKFEFRQLVWQIASDYAAAALLLRLPGYVPMPAFTAIEDVPLVVRHARKSPQQVRWLWHGEVRAWCACRWLVCAWVCAYQLRRASRCLTVGVVLAMLPNHRVHLPAGA